MIVAINVGSKLRFFMFTENVIKQDFIFWSQSFFIEIKTLKHSVFTVRIISSKKKSVISSENNQKDVLGQANCFGFSNMDLLRRIKIVAYGKLNKNRINRRRFPNRLINNKIYLFVFLAILSHITAKFHQIFWFSFAFKARTIFSMEITFHVTLIPPSVLNLIHELPKAIGVRFKKNFKDWKKIRIPSIH